MEQNTTPEKGLFSNPYTTERNRYGARILRTNGTHPERGIFASDLQGGCDQETARLIRLSFAKRRTAYKAARAFADAMNERHTDAELGRVVWGNSWTKIEDALTHVRALIAQGIVPFSQAVRIVARTYQQTTEHAGHMIRRNPQA